eukprot:s3656_g3.t1
MWQDGKSSKIRCPSALLHGRLDAASISVRLEASATRSSTQDVDHLRGEKGAEEAKGSIFGHKLVSTKQIKTWSIGTDSNIPPEAFAFGCVWKKEVAQRALHGG